MRLEVERLRVDRLVAEVPRHGGGLLGGSRDQPAQDLIPRLAARATGHHLLRGREHDPEQPVDNPDTVHRRASRLGRERHYVVDAARVLRSLRRHVLRQRALRERLEMKLERIEVCTRREILALEIGPPPDREQQVLHRHEMSHLVTGGPVQHMEPLAQRGLLVSVGHLLAASQ